jgi:ATP-dependent Zn protease
MSHRSTALSPTNTAYHEAGHAVVGYRLSNRFGWFPHYVHIEAGNGVDGATHFAQKRAVTAAEWRAKFYRIAAGPIAEFEHDGSDDGWEGDWDQIDTCMLYLPKSERFYWSRARQMVLRNWHAVEAVARALMDRKYLNGEELERVVQRADARRQTLSSRSSPTPNAKVR